MPGKVSIEVAVFSGGNAIMAQLQGASRVELNAPGSYASGGLTPPVSELTSVASHLQIPVRIMIRPVGKPLTTTAVYPTRTLANGTAVIQGAAIPQVHDEQDFIYSDQDFERMKQSIIDFKKCGAMNPIRGDGFVFGILRQVPDTYAHNFSNSQGSASPPIAPGPGHNEPKVLAIDRERCKILTALASPFPCIFHRAFDPIAEEDHHHRLMQGLYDLVHCGFEGVLTSGGLGSHEKHIEKLDLIISHSLEKQIQIIIGGNVRSHNIRKATAILGVFKDDAVWFHSASLTNPDSGRSDGIFSENLDTDELGMLLAQVELTDRI